MGKALKCFLFHCCLAHSKGFIINFVTCSDFFCIIQFVLRIHVIDVFSQQRSPHNFVFFFRLSDDRWHAMSFMIINCNLFSGWKETVKPPEEAAG